MDYLTVADVLAIHQIQIRNYGGNDGVRDMGALEAALYRPQTGYYKDIVEQAAALCESIAINHPFVDGNKRVAFASTEIFLRINGYRINSQSAKIYGEWMRLFDAQNFDFLNLEKWLREIVLPIPHI